MRDIKLNTLFMKAQYVLSWIGFVLGGGWLIAYILSIYGKNTSYDVEKKKGILNKTWQKFVFITGLIYGYFILIGFLWALVFI